MSKSIKLLLSSICVAWIVLWLANVIVDRGLRSTHIPKLAEWGVIFSGSVNADLIISGSSRGTQMYSPDILEATTRLKTFNLGMSGWATGMQLMRLKFYLKYNRPPKYLVQNVDFTVFSQREDLFEYEQFIPYLNDTLILHETQKYTGRFTFPERFFPLFKYNCKSKLIVEGIRSFVLQSQPLARHKGYYPNLEPWNEGDFRKFAATNKNGYKEAVLAHVDSQFVELITLCKQNNIKMVVVMAPFYSEGLELIANRAPIKARVMEICAQYSVPFLDYTKDTICVSTKYFFNATHLNVVGAQIFSRQLGSDLSRSFELTRK